MVETDENKPMESNADIVKRDQILSVNEDANKNDITSAAGRDNVSTSNDEDGDTESSGTSFYSDIFEWSNQTIFIQIFHFQINFIFLFFINRL